VVSAAQRRLSCPSSLVLAAGAGTAAGAAAGAAACSLGAATGAACGSVFASCDFCLREPSRSASSPLARLERRPVLS